MMKFFSRTKGAVSIFLVLILVPMLGVASVMVDSSRLKLGQAAASAAGDITLNTALSQYNNMLKDIYGLFATSQNNETLLESLGTYYKESIMVNGVTAEDANTYVEKLMNTFGVGGSTNNTRDLLNIAVDDFKVSAPTGANLANPLMLKKQITEFMKYRAPLNLGLEILDAVKIFKNLSKQTKVIEGQQKYYEEQKNVFSACEDAWAHLYDYAMEDYLPTEYYYNKMLWNFNGKKIVNDDSYPLDPDEDDTKFQGYYDKLALVAEHVALYFNNFDYYTNLAIKGASEESTSDIRVYKNGNYNSKVNLNSSISYKSGKTNYKDIRSAIGVVERAIGKVKNLQANNAQYKKYALALESSVNKRTQIEIIEQFNREYDKNNTQWIKAILDLKAAYESLKNAKDNFKTAAKPTKPTKPAEVSNPGTKPADPGTKPTSPGASATSSEKAAYSSDLSSWNAASKAVSDWYKASSAYNTYINVTLPNYQKALDEYPAKLAEWEEKYDDSKGCTLINAEMETASCTYKGSKTNTKQASDTLAKVGDYIKNFSKITCKIQSFYTNAKDAVTELMKTDAEVIKQVKEESKTLYIDNLETKIAALTAASTSLQNIANLLAPGGALDTKLKNWEKSANDSDLNDDETTLSQREEIENLKKFMSADDVNKLKTRVNNVKASLETTLTQLKGYKVGTKHLWELEVKSKPKDTIKAFQGLLTIGSFNINYPPIMKSGSKTEFDETHKEIWKNSYKHNGVVITDKNYYLLITTTWPDDSNPNPSVSFGQTKFYQYLYANFDTGEKPMKDGTIADKGKTKEDEQTSKAEDKADESKAAVEADNNKKSANNVSNMGNKPSSSWAGVCAEIENNSMNSIDTSNKQDLGKVSSGIGDLFKGLFDAISGAIIKVRDCLYLDSYIMNMFSYDTFEAEIVYNMQVDNGESNPKGMPISDNFWSGSTPNSKYSSEIAKAKSMTLTPITPDNNFAYGAEVEYILYGGTNSSNVTKAYATIFGIRLALNLVYAFTDSEIRDGAFAIASAIFGVPPLTVLIPAAKIAIIIAIAIAESAYDIFLLKQGRAVPIYKSSDTWNMKLSNIIEKAAAGAVDAVIDKGTNLLTNWLEKTSDELSDLINKNKEKFANAMEDAIKDKFDKYAYLPLEQLADECTAANMMEACGEFTKIEDKVAHVEDRLDKWLEKQGLSGHDVVYEIKATAVEACKGKIEDMFTAMEKSAQGEIDAVKKCVDQIRDKITSTVNSAIDEVGSGLNKVKDDIINEIEEAAAKGADNLKDLITSNIDTSFGKSSTGFAQKGSTSVLTSLLSWQYSDYMNLFLLIATLANEEKVLLRTADVIQANMQHINNKAGITDVFLMEKANTYLKVEAKVQVKPLMLALPMIQETTKNKLSGVNWYTISYSATKGY